jgi:SAM-dependent methyltransferase
VGKGAPLRWLENHYLRGFLRGRGLEIGALWRRFPVHPSAQTWYMDRAHTDELKSQYSDVKERIFPPDFIADAIELPLASGKLDFLIASHVLEHLPFPLAALRAWYGALVPAGKLLIKVPDKRYTFDFRRARTPLPHLLAEDAHPELTDWRAHYADFVENVDCRKPSEQELTDGAAGLETGTFNIHFHAWTDEDIHDPVEFTRQVWKFNWYPRVFWEAHSYRKEVTVLLVRA